MDFPFFFFLFPEHKTETHDEVFGSLHFFGLERADHLTRVPCVLPECNVCVFYRPANMNGFFFKILKFRQHIIIKLYQSLKRTAEEHLLHVFTDVIHVMTQTLGHTVPSCLFLTSSNLPQRFSPWPCGHTFRPLTSH